MRRARITAAESAVAPYLPDNYRIEAAGKTGGQHWTIIAGEDVAGWTLDDYVLPRLASGLIFGMEIPTKAAMQKAWDQVEANEAASAALDEGSSDD